MVPYYIYTIVFYFIPIFFVINLNTKTNSNYINIFSLLISIFPFTILFFNCNAIIKRVQKKPQKTNKIIIHLKTMKSTLILITKPHFSLFLVQE